MLPNEASIIRLVGAVLMEQNDEWQLQHRYLSLEPLADLGQSGDEDQILLVPPAAAPILTPRSAWGITPAGQPHFHHSGGRHLGRRVAELEDLRANSIVVAN